VFTQSDLIVQNWRFTAEIGIKPTKKR
jgi:hypothetical protein